MKKLLYIDACIRDEESRTKRIAEPIVKALEGKYDIQRYTLNDMNLSIVQKDLVKERNSGIINPMVMTWAETVRDADRIVIAAPFWDMSIPAALKNFLELCSILDVTFKTNDKTCYGNCRAEKMLFITTRGMDIPTGDVREQATSYLKALSWLWGIGPLQVVAAQNMDYASAAEIEEKIGVAIQEGLAIVNDF
ncbi:MAG: NAD(P)H-dependent oxidoreductase [Bacteroidales bacterium]|nr:NAD(P)H-dependent oxidoreductase [Bacteroidales bacterium]